MYELDTIRKTDPEVADAIQAEFERQNSHIELIASENWVSKAVMAAMGSVLTNKYAEGYPEKRYYGGCQCVDVTEDLARERAKRLFGCGYANVQPHSGAQDAGLKQGTVITGLNGTTIDSMATLQEQLQYYAAGTTVELTVQVPADGGSYEEQTVEVTLGTSAQ